LELEIEMESSSFLQKHGHGASGFSVVSTLESSGQCGVILFSSAQGQVEGLTYNTYYIILLIMSQEPTRTPELLLNLLNLNLLVQPRSGKWRQMPKNWQMPI